MFLNTMKTKKGKDSSWNSANESLLYVYMLQKSNPLHVYMLQKSTNSIQFIVLIILSICKITKI